MERSSSTEDRYRAVNSWRGGAPATRFVLSAMAAAMMMHADEGRPDDAEREWASIVLMAGVQPTAWDDARLLWEQGDPGRIRGHDEGDRLALVGLTLDNLGVRPPGRVAVYYATDWTSP